MPHDVQARDEFTQWYDGGARTHRHSARPHTYHPGDSVSAATVRRVPRCPLSHTRGLLPPASTSLRRLCLCRYPPPPPPPPPAPPPHRSPAPPESTQTSLLLYRIGRDSRHASPMRDAGIHDSCFLSMRKIGHGHFARGPYFGGGLGKFHAADGAPPADFRDRL